MKKTIFILLICVVLFTQFSFAKGVGTTMFQILQIPTNAYDAALANTSGIIGNSVLVNPSIIPFVDKSIILSHAIYIQDIQYSAGALTIPINNYSGLNIGFYYFDMGTMDKTLEYNDSYISDGNFNANDKIIKISYGTLLGEHYSVGISLTHISQNIDNVSYSGISTSVSGMYFITNDTYLNLGLNNLGPDVSGYSLPTNLYCSLVSPIGEKSIGIIQFDDYYNDEIINCKIAMEIGIEDILFLRSGYNLPINKNYDGTNNIFITNMTLGLGVKIKSAFIDYAFLPKGDFGNIHMFTLKINI